MDIVQLKYFVTIVESDLNITSAALKLSISQPALTKVLRKFEDDEGVQLFRRSNGRLKSLTAVGESFYENAKVVLSSHDFMMNELREQSSTVRGKIKIGVPPLILTVLFTDILSKLINENPDIQFEIVEQGGFELQKLLKLQEIDFAIILKPTNLSCDHFVEKTIYEDELACFMSVNHPLANADYLTFNDLRDQKLAIFNNTFMIYHQLINMFGKLSISPKIAFTSSSWSFLVESTLNSDYITIMPRPTKNFCSNNNLKVISIKNTIPWNVVLSYAKKSNYSRMERHVLKSITEYFIKN